MMKVDEEFCQNEPEKYKFCMPHYCVEKNDSCHLTFSVNNIYETPIMLVFLIILASILLGILLAIILDVYCQSRRGSRIKYQKTDQRPLASDAALNECDPTDPESPIRQMSTKAKLCSFLPSRGYKLIPMLSGFPGIRKGFTSPTKSNASCANLEAQSKDREQRLSDLGRSKKGSPIVMSPEAAAAAGHKYRLLPNEAVPSRIYKNPAATTGKDVAQSKTRKVTYNNKTTQTSILAKIT